MSGLLGSFGLSVVRSLSSWFYHRRTLVALSAAGRGFLMSSAAYRVPARLPRVARQGFRTLRTPRLNEVLRCKNVRRA